MARTRSHQSLSGSRNDEDRHVINTGDDHEDKDGSGRRCGDNDDLSHTRRRIAGDRIVLMCVLDTTDERHQTVNFPEPLLYYSLAILARDDLSVTDWSDLDDALIQISVPQATSKDAFLTESTPDADIQRLPGNVEAIAAFQAERIDAGTLLQAAECGAPDTGSQTDALGDPLLDAGCLRPVPELPFAVEFHQGPDPGDQDARVWGADTGRPWFRVELQFDQRLHQSGP